ncbi:complex I subunit 4 family protein [Acidomonas methanolica]|uniref:complex I subunit 4 family protein n=1 Tax=Acidomonas methanolica TaxID=437 RepID=UPI002119E545|nr:NADH-quinone oxidoreductase subunit M [Acidomonas methanolica]MCQ9155672.1 NADH-quinone oxidoreductase subunit M [Acidomonas methanolica]
MFALPALIALPFLGGLAAWLVGLRNGSARLPWLVSLLTLLLEALLLLGVTGMTGGSGWRGHFAMPWIPLFGIDFRLDMDGLSLVMLWLNLAIAVPVLLTSSREIKERPGLYHFLTLATIAGINGVFLSTDLFLFFFFWELMLLPMFGVLLIWGGEHRARATLKFFIFTQGSGLLMLLSILALVFVHVQETGQLTFNYFALAGTGAMSRAAFPIMLGFLIAFAVKLPIVPFHAWAPEVYAEAPNGGTILLAGILGKTGAYGLIRFVFELFPAASAQVAPVVMAFAVVGILYCGWLAVAQDDMKRLVAYSSLSHLGYVVLGIFSGTTVGMEGAVVMMVAHGLSTSAIFLITGFIEERTGTRDMRRLGGLWPAMPQLSAFAMFFACALLGLPGIGDFVGEFLTLLATWHVNHVMAFFAAAGAVLSSIYALTWMLRVFYGPPVFAGEAPLGRPVAGVMWTLGAATVLLLVIGFFPQPLLDLSAPAAPQQIVSLAGGAR